MMGFFKRLFSLLVIVLCSRDLFADSPKPWQMGFQEPATQVMEDIIASHNYVMWIMTAILALVFFLLLYVILRFRRKENEKIVFNNKHSHNVLIEIMWTVIPLIVVGFLTINNVRLIRYQTEIPKTDLTLKVIGYQWYWGYHYPDNKDISFDSYMKPDSELNPGELRLLEVDKRVIVPVNTNVRLQVTAADVIHSWAVPSLGIKLDAIPGRLNETWFNVKKPGVYYGQCSELCGRLHGFMPIVVVAVSQEQFDEWVKQIKV